jgi:hypothetical protein
MADVAHPYPERSTGPLMTLSLASAAPPGPHEPARHRAAEVLLTDATWTPVTVLAWHRLDQPFEHVITHSRITWLVQLRLSDGSENWYDYTGLNLRPVRGSGSRSASER